MSKKSGSDQQDAIPSRESPNSNRRSDKADSSRSEERAIITGRLMAFAQKWEQRYAEEHDGL